MLYLISPTEETNPQALNVKLHAILDLMLTLRIRLPSPHFHSHFFPLHLTNM